jgi:hypothetical protein
VKLEDITVEVRNKALARVGTILPRDLDFTLTNRFNNVGEWELKLPAEHPMVPFLETPGSGLIINGPSDVLVSGPTIKPKRSATPLDTRGTLTFSGATDDVILSDYLAWPTPTSDTVAGQVTSHDVRTANAETLLHQYVNANCGPGAPVSRRAPYLTMGTNLNRGPSLKKSARFPVLGLLLAEIASLGNLGFRIVQRGSVLMFETFAVVDRTDEIRLDIHNGTLSGHTVEILAPGVTHVMVAGQGEGVDRAFLLATSPASIAAQAEWGRRIEKFVDQRQTDDETEYQQKADEILKDQGFTGYDIQVVPQDDESSTMRFGRDWNIGDGVSVVVNGEELPSTVTGYKLKASSDGFKLGATIGQPLVTQVGSQGDINSRVSALERNAEFARLTDITAAIETARLTTIAYVNGLSSGIYSDLNLMNLGQRDQAGLIGGGVKGADSGGIYWSDRFLAISNENLAASRPDGYLEIDMPSDTTVIPSYSGGSSVTVAGGKIPLGAFTALWYEPPVDGFASDSSKFRVSNWSDPGEIAIPYDWILIAIKNGDSTSSGLRWGTGELDDTWRALGMQNGWASYDGGFENPAYRKVASDTVQLQGLVKHAGASSFSTIGTLPVGFRPLTRKIFTVIGNSPGWSPTERAVRLDVLADGQVSFSSTPGTTGATSITYLSLEGITFHARA